MIGERLKELREEFRMTQDQLASILNVSHQSISGYENNSNEPSLENLNLLDKCNKELLFFYYLMDGYKIIKK
ncbi:UNVERIFIED_ORG: hypothetical protein B2H98_17880 [Clostridium botulinum]